MFKLNSFHCIFRSQALAGLAVLFLATGCLSGGSSGDGAASSGTPSPNPQGYGTCTPVRPLADATGFNVFTSGDFTAPSSLTEGRMAVGGNAYLSNYSIGSKLSVDVNRADLVVGANLNFVSGAVLSGKTIYGGSFSSSASSSAGGFYQEANFINFTAASNALKSISQKLAALTPNASVIYNNISSRHDSVLVGNDPVINVFTMTTDDLERSQAFDVTVPVGATALINVTGNAATLAGFAMNIHGSDIEHVIFNFPNATSLYFTNISFLGSVLAPESTSTFSSGQFSGQFIGGVITYAQGQFNEHSFAGCLPLSL